MTAAVIGTGYMGKTHVAILSRLADKLVLCSADEATGKALAAQYGCSFYADYTQMLEAETPDFVSVCVPTFLHFPVVKAILERGIPVLCEKPFTLDEASAVTLTELAKTKGVLLMVAHCLRFSRPYAFLKQCIDSRQLGQLRSLHMYRNSAKPNWSVGNWFSNVQRSGGIIRDLHIHDTDMAVNLLGLPQAVYTSGSDCTCSSVFSYGEDLTVTAAASWRNAPAFPFSAGFDAVFEDGCLVFDKDVLTLYSGDSQLHPLEEAGLPPEFASEDMMENELRYFVQCVQTGASPALCPPEQTLQTIFLSCAQSRSAAGGIFETVDFPKNL